MSLLTIVREACDRIGLVRPATVIGSSDAQVRTLLALSNQDGKHLLSRHNWQDMIKETTFTATATETQAGSGAMPDDFGRVIPGTFWNRTADRRVAGPLSPQRWQMLKSGLVVMPYDAFRIRGGSLLMSPTPTAGDTMAYEYVTKYWCAGSADTTPDQTAWVSDTDISFLDEELMTLGIIWRFKRSKGLDYGEDFVDYEARLASLSGNDGGQADLDMGIGDDGSAVLDPYTPDGNWSIS